jgi:hypothetical protein
MMSGQSSLLGLGLPRAAILAAGNTKELLVSTETVPHLGAGASVLGGPGYQGCVQELVLHRTRAPCAWQLYCLL